VASLAIEEAAATTGRSVHTVYRWQRSGIDVTDRAELLSYSELQDHRARGSAFQKSRRRRLAAFDAAQAASEFESRFSGVDPGQFVELPAPFSLESAERAKRLLREIQAGFSERLARLTRLKPTGHEINIKLAKSELEEITAAYQILDNVFERFPD